MAGNYTVKQGDHLAGIAAQFGFADYTPIWNHPNNADLQSQRPNPNVLYPGDEIYIPDKSAGSYDKPSDQQHKFVAKTSPLKLRLKLENVYSKPIANTPCDLLIAGDTSSLTTDGNGQIEKAISKDVKDATLTIHETITVNGEDIQEDVVMSVKIGYLDPVEEVSGQVGRLSNLGYYRLDPDAFDQDEFQSAVEEFQCENGLTVDGDCGPDTQAKLKQVHGC